MAHDYEEVTDSMLRAARPRWPIWALVAVAVAGGATVAVLLLRELQRSRNETAVAQAKALEAQGRLEVAQRAQSDAAARLERLEADRTELTALRNELTRDVQAKEEELATVKSATDELQERMKAEIAKGEIRLSQANGRLTVDLVDKILFDSGDARISKRGEGVLTRLGGALARIGDRQIQVAGHTDDAPISARLRARYPTNWELSTCRATNVVRFLEERAHLPPARLVAMGYGPNRPVASNSTPRGRARNRRIEILLAPALAPAPSHAEPAKDEASTPPPAPRAKLAGKRYAKRRQ